MSTDKKVTKDLIETLEDGKDGFALAADKLMESDRPDLGPVMRKFSEQRARFASQLETMAARYGDDIEEDGSVAAKVHRVWMSLKDTLTGSDPSGVLDAAEQGEDHAVSEYEDALAQDISVDLRNVVQEQFSEVKQAHDEVKTLRDSVS